MVGPQLRVFNGNSFSQTAQRGKGEGVSKKAPNPKINQKFPTVGVRAYAEEFSDLSTYLFIIHLLSKYQIHNTLVQHLLPQSDNHTIIIRLKSSESNEDAALALATSPTFYLHSSLCSQLRFILPLLSSFRRISKTLHVSGAVMQTLLHGFCVDFPTRSASSSLAVSWPSYMASQLKVAGSVHKNYRELGTVYDSNLINP